MKRVATIACVSLCFSGQPSAVLPPSNPVHSFRPVSTFLVPDRNSAEIVAATPDEMTLVYTDAIGSTVGVVDISNPSHPLQIGTISIVGQPTSVAITPDGRYAVAAVRLAIFEGEDIVNPADPGPSGELQLFDLANLTAPPVRYPIAPGPGGALGYLPDSVALGTIGSQLYAAVALENEPIVLRRDGADYLYVEPEPVGLPPCPPTPSVGSPDLCDASAPGYVQVVRVRTGLTPGFEFASNVAFPQELMGGLLYPDDPQPEYVAFNHGVLAVTLQENNGIAVIDLSFPAVPSVSMFSAGVVDSRPADLLDDATISFITDVPG